MAKVVAINISEKKKTPKKSIPEGKLIENYGFEGDAHAGNWHRQVSLLAKESIERAQGMRTDGLCHGMFAENITTEGIVLHTLPVGTKLKIGGEAVLEITQIGKECHDGCAIRELVGQCIMPKEGIFCKVLTGGTVKAEDEITVL
ncbi:MAG: MOSC domain-containing protein [Clostridiaceae bacterium]|nr:MOSC domain-containing protein [Clostridiaceae bacterium]